MTMYCYLESTAICHYHGTVYIMVYSTLAACQREGALVALAGVAVCAAEG